MKAIFNRLREPSTWAGLGVLGALFGVNPAIISAVQGAVGAVSDGASTGGPGGLVQAITGICAVAAVLVPEQKPPLLIVKGGQQ